MWRYEAIDLREPGRPVRRKGEIAGETAADARAALRAVGLQVLRIEPYAVDRRRPARTRGTLRVPRLSQVGELLKARRMAPQAEPEDSPAPERTADTSMRRNRLADTLFRGRRVQERADAFDALATLLESGVPLAEAVETLAEAHDGHSRGLRRVLLAVREDLRAGRPLSVALARHPGWFDEAEVAMVDAAEVAGTLSTTLAEVARRQARSAATMQKLVGALAYPAVVATIGVAVALFLATQTLPQLVAILVGAKLEVPALTAGLVAVGTAVRDGWWILAIAVVSLPAAAIALGPRTLARLAPRWRARLDALVPLAIRRMATARALLRIADLLRAGVPLVEALRTVGNGCTGPASGLGAALLAAAKRVEEGDDFATALAPPPAPEGGKSIGRDAAGASSTSLPRTSPGTRARASNFRGWFDGECVRLVAVGEATGDLARVLERLGERYERQTARLVDRMAGLLEPAAVIALAALVGTVVMAAVLPLLRLQEIL